MSDGSRKIYEFIKGPSNPMSEKGGGFSQEDAADMQSVLKLSSESYCREMENKLLLEHTIGESLKEITTPPPKAATEDADEQHAFELSLEELSFQIAVVESLKENTTPPPKAATGISGFLKTGNLSNFLSYSRKKDDNILKSEDDVNSMETIAEILMNDGSDPNQLHKALVQISAYYKKKNSSLVAIHEKASQYPGIENIANFCYQNTIFQILSCIPEFRNHVSVVRNTKTLHDLLNYLNVENNKYVSSQTITQVLKDLELYTQYDGVRQQDAEEFLTQLFAKLTADYTKYFSFMFNKQLQCNKCHKIKTKIDPSLTYHITIGDFTQTGLILQTMIDSDTTLKDPDQTEKSNCERCDKDMPHHEIVTLEYPPCNPLLPPYNQYLLIHLKRSNFENERKIKYTRPIMVNQKLDINNQHFDLCGIGVHVGTPDGGHWYAYKKINEQWVCCNDTVTTIIDNIDEVADLHLGTIYCYQKKSDSKK